MYIDSNQSSNLTLYFRSLNGDGMFNYRMVFPFEYSETKQKVILMKKVQFLCCSTQLFKTVLIQGTFRIEPIVQKGIRLRHRS